jgi:hypothetical protein
LHLIENAVLLSKIKIMQVVAIQEIKAKYPNEWVLLGNPKTVLATVQSGILLFHGKDYLEVCYKGSELGANYDSRTIIYTGETQQKNRKWLKAIRLDVPTPMT